MLSLKTAMIYQFGAENASPYFNRIMIGATGAGVCLIVVTMAVYTIVRANKELEKLRKS